jgi:hypothetical protein
MNDGKTEDFVVEPKWYLEIRSKIRYRSNRFLATFLLPFIFTGFVITFEVAVFIAIHADLNSPVVNDLVLVTFFIWLVIFYFLIRKMILKKETKYDSFDLFAYTCGSIGLEIKRILLVPNYEYDFQSISSLMINSWFVRRKCKSTDDDNLRKSLKELPHLSFKINNLVDNVEANRDTLTKISDEFIEIGNRIEKKIKPRILIESIDKVINLLKSGIVKPKKISRYKAYFKVKRITFTLVEIIGSLVVGGITFYLTKNIGESILACVGIAAAIPGFYVVVKSI